MSATIKKLNPAPSQLSEKDFVEQFGSIYEHSPWVAEQAWQKGLNQEQDTPEGLAKVLAAQVDAADAQRQLKLIRAHPDLGGKAAKAGTLTAESTREQAGAGLDKCTPEQFERLQRLNTQYTEKFGFPFIIAVTGLDRDGILDAMDERIKNDQTTERKTAMEQIHRIARIRLDALAE